jgi:hypothetical protein
MGTELHTQQRPKCDANVSQSNLLVFGQLLDLKLFLARYSRDKVLEEVANNLNPLVSQFNTDARTENRKIIKQNANVPNCAT